MFGIGLPEMIVILAVALIVVGPERLLDLARSVAKWMFELKKTVNQVKESLTEEENLLDSVHSDLKKTAHELKGNLIESDDHFSWHEPGSPSRVPDGQESDVIDMDEPQPPGEEGQQGTQDQEAGEAIQQKPAENKIESEDGREKDGDGSADKPAP